MKSIYIYIIILFVLCGNIFAQRNISLVGLTYSVGFATSKTHDYISNTSFAGFNIDGRKSIGKNLWAGLSLGWNVFGEQNSELIELQNGAISGTQGRYLNSFPILANISYGFSSGSNAKFIPYIALNAGAYYITQRFDIGTFSFQNDNTHFGGAPELGFLINTNSVYMMFYGRYNYAFDSGTRLSGDEKNDHSYLSLNLGIAYKKLGF